jgi:poly(ADP-ribose) glycohydrolase
VAIDAERYDRPKKQYEMSRIGRELKKCFTGFHQNKTFRFSNLPAIATGNWGCGAFMGNIELKCIYMIEI